MTPALPSFLHYGPFLCRYEIGQIQFDRRYSYHLTIGKQLYQVKQTLDSQGQENEQLSKILSRLEVREAMSPRHSICY